MHTRAKRKHAIRALSIFTLILPLAGCGGTWDDDRGNFKRVFGFDRPADVQVLHSFYWKSPHWTTEYRYFIALHAPATFIRNLTDPLLMQPGTLTGDAATACGSNPPSWFLPPPMTRYRMWVSHKEEDTYRVFLDPSTNTVYACDQRL